MNRVPEQPTVWQASDQSGRRTHPEAAFAVFGKRHHHVAGKRNAPKRRLAVSLFQAEKTSVRTGPDSAAVIFMEGLNAIAHRLIAQRIRSE